MDVERTMEFILKSQARAEARMDRADARAERTDKRLDSVAKLLQQGARVLARTEKKIEEVIQLQKRNDVVVAELRQSQKETGKSLKAFINSLKHGRNGRNGR